MKYQGKMGTHLEPQPSSVNPQTKAKKTRQYFQQQRLCYISGSRDHFALAIDNTCTKVWCQ
jgi:hypothetical protein